MKKLLVIVLALLLVGCSDNEPMNEVNRYEVDNTEVLLKLETLNEQLIELNETDGIYSERDMKGILHFMLFALSAASDGKEEYYTFDGDTFCRVEPNDTECYEFDEWYIGFTEELLN